MFEYEYARTRTVQDPRKNLKEPLRERHVSKVADQYLLLGIWDIEYADCNYRTRIKHNIDRLKVYAFGKFGTSCETWLKRLKESLRKKQWARRTQAKGISVRVDK